jgi:hypothetical protein
VMGCSSSQLACQTLPTILPTWEINAPPSVSCGMA